MKNQKLSRYERLKKSGSIENLFKEGDGFPFFPFKVIYSFTVNDIQSDCVSKVAFVVPKRQFKKAVDRNHLKRQMKEAFRKNKSRLYEALNKNKNHLEIVILYIANEGFEYQVLEKKMINLLEELIQKQN